MLKLPLNRTISHDLRRCGLRAAAQDRADQALRPGGLRGHAQGRATGRRMPRPARRRGEAGRADRAHRPLRVRVRHGSRRASRDPDVSRLQQVDLHLDQPRGLPRHPERQAAAGRRHRQHRRDPDRRRLARRFEPHVSGRRNPAQGRAADRGHLRGDAARHRGGEARAAPPATSAPRSRASSSRST